MDVPIGPGLLGHVLDALGNPIDGKSPIEAIECRRASLKVPGILPCRSVNQPMMTGLKPINALVAIGCDQHELIVGNCQTGKTVTINTILNQKHWNNGRMRRRNSTVSTLLLVRSVLLWLNSSRFYFRSL